MKCCVSADVETWTNLLTFQPDPDYSPDAGTGLLSPISYALQRRILLRRENLTYRYWAPIAAARSGFKMVLFTASHWNAFVGDTCTLPSALLVFCFILMIHKRTTKNATTFWQRRRLWVKLQGEMQKTSLLPSQQPPTSESTRWDSVVKAEQCRRS